MGHLTKSKVVHTFVENNYPIDNVYKYNEKTMQTYKFTGNFDCLLVKANMRVGKTKNIHKLFKDYKKILIVTFRISLCEDLADKFDFYLYNKEETNEINLDLYDKVVCQINSLGKIVGKFNLLVLKTLYLNICNITKIILLDALFDGILVLYFQ